MLFLSIAEFLCLIGIPVALIGFLFQLARKKPNKKTWGITLIAFLAVFVVCVAVTPSSDSTDKEDSTDKISVAEDDTPPEELTNKGEYDNCTIELQDATLTSNGQDEYLIVSAIYTNNKSEPQYASSAFAIRAFQNDMMLEDLSFDQEDSGNLTKEIRNGASVNVSFMFMLEDDSEVEVLIGTPTADRETIGRQIYLNTENNQKSTDTEDSTDKISVAEADKATETAESFKDTKEPVSESSESGEASQPQQEDEEGVDTSVTFEEIYKAYKQNELRADEKYQYNRYRVTAKINGMETDGLLNLTGGATLTMEIKIDNTIVFFYAEFEKEQEEALKKVNVGDTITFEGKCLSAGSWTDCEIIVG